MRRMSRQLSGPLRRFTSSLRSTQAATSTEYAILLGLIVVVLLVGVRFFGQTVVDLFETYPELVSS